MPLLYCLLEVFTSSASNNMFSESGFPGSVSVVASHSAHVAVGVLVPLGNGHVVHVGRVFSLVSPVISKMV